MLILNNGQLKQFYQKSQKDKIIAVDTEFHRINTYFPKLCLIQISNLSQSIIIDPIDFQLDFKLIEEIIYDIKIKKIFHSASQDIEILFNLFEKVPKNIHDTQICLMPLGYDNSTSYARACMDFLKIEISKENQFIDWRSRPLSKDKIDYAINDVKYLIPLYKKIMTNLEKINRVSWIDSMHEKVLNKNNFKKRRERAWEKIKFNPKNEYELKILKKLSFLRETFAIKENKPPKRFIENKVLIKLCKFQLKPHEKKEALKNIKNQRLGIAIKKILDQTTTRKKIKAFEEKLCSKRKKVMQFAKILLEKKSKELNIHPSLIANKLELEKIVLGDDNIIKNWKYEIFSKEYEMIKKLI